MERERETGTVKWFSAVKGYGFIARDDGGDVFVHHSQLDGEGRRTLVPEQRVEFAVETDERGGKAVHVVGSVPAEGTEEKVMEEVYDEELRARTVYVGNLSYETSDAELRRVFEQVGEALSVARITGGHGRRRYGFVEMGDPDAARRAIRQLNGAKVDNRAMNVRKTTPRSSGGRGLSRS